MRLEDWREWPPERLTALFDRQRTRWQTELSWDAGTLFTTVEQARSSGQLPGLVAVEDDGRIAGWCYASVQDGLLFIGALHGDRADVIRQLLDAVLATPEASYVRAYRCFVFPDGPAVAAALVRRRFEVQPFLYMTRPLPWSKASGSDAVVRPWVVDDLPETARLLARAYAGTSDSRCFAPGDRLEEWAGYLAYLVRTPACGVWAPGESMACSLDGASGRLDAILIATRLKDDTSHIAQIVVDPRVRGRGLATGLIAASTKAATDNGASRQTLFVAESNAAARGLYSGLGFTHVSCFVYADRPRISRVASEPSAETA